MYADPARYANAVSGQLSNRLLADCSRLINHGKTISIIAQILCSVTVCRMRSFSPRFRTRALEHWHILKWFLV